MCPSTNNNNDDDDDNSAQLSRSTCVRPRPVWASGRSAPRLYVPAPSRRPRRLINFLTSARGWLSRFVYLIGAGRDAHGGAILQIFSRSLSFDPAPIDAVQRWALIDYVKCRVTKIKATSRSSQNRGLVVYEITNDLMY